MAKTLSAPVNVRVSLQLPEGLYDQYAERATKRGVGVESELLAQITRTRNWVDSTPIYLDNASRNELSVLAGKSLHNQDDLMAWIRSTAAVSVAGVKIELSAPLRLKIDAQRYRTPFKEFLQEKVVEVLERWLNLR